jgi:hypothetical protein
MTAEQYRLLLQDLARLADPRDGDSLLEHGRAKVGALDTVMVHAPEYDPDLLQVRMRVGTLPEPSGHILRGILEANFISGFGGECVFSLFPNSRDVVMTLRHRLDEATTPQDLWQGLTDVARNAEQMWLMVLDNSGTQRTEDFAASIRPYPAPGMEV